MRLPVILICLLVACGASLGTAGQRGVEPAAERDAAAQQAGRALFEDVHARGRIAEAKVQTIRARFTETTVSSLLARPLVSKGTLISAKPPRLRLNYTSPERKTIVMDGNRLTVVWHDRAETERIDITEIMKRVNQYFTNADPAQLRKAFTAQATIDREVANTYRLDMVPTRRQLEEGLQRLEIWLDRDTLLMRQMKMSFPGGNSDTIRIEGAELNVPLPPNAFEIDDVKK